MEAHGSRSTTTCTFTSSFSTRDGKRFADCCSASKPSVFVFCDQCDPALDLARCTTCYGKFASKLRRRLPEIASSMGATLHLEPALKALLDTDWAAMGRGDRRAGNDFIHFVEKSSNWRWRSACPCCYDFQVPEVKHVMPQDFAQRAPRVLAMYELFVLAPVLDPAIGRLSPPVRQMVRIVELGEILSKGGGGAIQISWLRPPRAPALSRRVAAACAPMWLHRPALDADRGQARLGRGAVRPLPHLLGSPQRAA